MTYKDDHLKSVSRGVINDFCPLCTQDKPIYQMRNVCCRARFLIHQPTLEQRRGWLELWGKQLGKEQINEIKSLTLKWWEDKKCKIT